MYNIGTSCILAIIFAFILWFQKRTYITLSALCVALYLCITQDISNLWALPVLLVFTNLEPTTREPIANTIMFILLIHGILTMTTRLHGIIGNANMMAILFIFAYFELKPVCFRTYWLLGLLCTMSVGGIIVFILLCILFKHKPDLAVLPSLLLTYLTIIVFQNPFITSLSVCWVYLYTRLPKTSCQRKYLYILLLLILCFIIPFFRPSFIGTMLERLYMMRDTIQIIIAYPFGVGYLEWHKYLPQYNTLFCHNSYLQVIAEQGLWCIIPMIISLYSTVRFRNRCATALHLHSLVDITMCASSVLAGYFLIRQPKEEEYIMGLTETQKYILVIMILGVAIWVLMRSNTIAYI